MRLKQISKRSLAIILSVLMVLSTVMVGTISTANAADTSANTSGANMTGGEKIYLKPNSNWTQADAWFAAYFFSSSGSKWVPMQKDKGDSAVYEVTAPAGNWTNVNFVRMNPAHTTCSWDARWNEIGDLTFQGEKNMYVVPDGWWTDKNSNNNNWTYYYTSVDHTGGFIYFDNTNTNWSENYVQLLMGYNGDSSNTRAQLMEKLNGTNLYYCNIASYSGAKYFAVIGDDATWNTNSASGFNTRTGANKYTDVYTGYQFLTGSSYLITTSNSTLENDSDIDINVPTSYQSYTSLNSTQTVKVQSKTTDQSSYSDDSFAGNVTISSYQLTGNGVSTAKSDSTSESDASASVSAAKTATVTLTATPNSGCTFDGWYDGTTQVSTEATYTYTASEAKTLTAKFTGEPVVKHTVTATVSGGNGTISPATQDVEEDSEYTVTLSPNAEYQVSSLMVNDTEMVSQVVNDVYTGRMGTEDVTIVASFALIDPNKEYSINYTSQDGVTLSYPATAKAGDTVTVTVDVEDGYTCTIVSVNNTEKTVTDGKITFTMPASNVTLTTNVAVKTLSTEWDIYGYGNDSTVNSDMDPADLIKGTMNGVEFAYYELNVDNTNDFRFMIGKNGTKYEHQNNNSQSTVEYLNTYGADVTINNHGADDINFAKVSGHNTYYIVLYYPNTNYGTWNGINIDNSSNSKAVVCAYTELPGDGYKDKFQVSIEQGVNDYYLDATRGTSTLETGKTTDKFEYDNNTVTFTTETKKVTDTTLGVTDMYIYRVYGYSILITYKDNSQKVVSIDEQLLSTSVKGTYSASYTFEPNEEGSEVKSAVVTPLFTSSKEYAELKGISFTTVYLKATPGSNLISNTMEPKYYTWRIVEERNADNSTYTQPKVTLDGVTYASLPEGKWNGQKMLYLGNGMYKAIVEDKILGIVFTSDASKIQTFDYSEFIKLQDLGYEQITFEPKEGVSGGVASTLKDNYGDESKTYTADTTDCSSYITPELTKSNFELDVNIEGYYVDVFGNKLVDANGNYIKQADLLAEMKADDPDTEINTSTEATALLAKMDTAKMSELALYGARYGVTNVDGGFYGMTYATRVYYFEVTGDKTYMVSQQVSGYGTIEGAYSPIEDGVTNAVAYNNKYGSKMEYAAGANPDEKTGDFTNGYELIPQKFVGVPFFVSYQYEVNPRIDGKWYYQSEIADIEYKMEIGLMDADDNLQYDESTGKLKIDPTGGSAYFAESGITEVSRKQGETTTLIANSNPGYKFVGFYEPDGTRISSSNNHVLTVAQPGTVFAVFQPIENNTVVVTNNVYRGSNPKDGGGNGDVTVTLNVYSDEAGTNLLRTETDKNIAQLEIADNEYFQWVITGVPSGVDTFVGFRTPDPDTGYYGLLDVQFNEDGYGYQYVDGVHSYTSAMMLMDWSNYDGTTLTIENVTDFNKTSYIVDLHYTYKDRYEQKKTYIVTDIELTTDEMLNGYKPSATTIKNNAPYIDEVFKDCTWVVDEDLSNVTQTGAVYTLVATQEYKSFYTFVDTTGNGEEFDLQYYSQFNTTVNLSAEHTRVATDENGKEITENFLYWKQYKTNSNGEIIGDESEENILSYYPRATVRVTFDSVIYAVYGVDPATDFSTSVKDPVYTREQYTVDGTNFDYVFADLLLQYDISQIFSDGATFKEFFKENDVKFGFILENDVASTPYDGNGTPVGPSVDAAYEDTYKENLNNVIANLANKAVSAEDKKASSWSEATTKDADDYNFYYNLYELSNNVDLLTDLGRMDYIIRFANTEKNQGIVYNVYSYIIYGDTIYISSPKVMNIYEIGNKTVDNNATV